MPIIIAQTPGVEGGVSYSATILADTPVAYWRLGESSGTIADNAEGTAALDGTYANSPTLGVAGALVGDANTAVTFDGTTQVVSVPDDAALDLGDTFSLEAWIKQGEFDRVIMSKGTDSFSLYVDAGVLTAAVAPWSAFVSAPSVLINDSVWHHIVVTKDGSARAIYVDGIARTQLLTDDTVLSNALPLYIGGDGGATCFKGSLDEVAIYDYALTAAQVLEHYTVGLQTGGGEEDPDDPRTYTDHILLDDIPTIDTTGTAEVTATLNNWIAGIASGTDNTHHARLVFPAGTFLMTRSLFVSAKQHMTLKGQGDTTIIKIKAGAIAEPSGLYASNINIGSAYPGTYGAAYGCTDIVVRDMKLYGNNPDPGMFEYPSEWDSQCGIYATNSSELEFHHVTVEAVGGDAFFPYYNVTTVSIHDNTVIDCGRNGLSIGGNVWDVLAERNNIIRAGYYVIDIEPYGTTRTVHDVVLRDSSWGSFGPDTGSGHGFCAVLCGQFSTAWNIEISGWTCTGSVASSSYYRALIHSAPGYLGTMRPLNIKFKNNTATQTAPPDCISIAGVDTLDVSGNTQPTSSGDAYLIVDCTDVTGP